jgi:hypothetical protein
LGTAECTGDIEIAAEIAPKAQIVVFEGTNTDSIIQNMISNPTISQFSSSWFVGFSPITQTLLTVMAAQGQSFFEASGDFGAYEPPVLLAGCGMAVTNPPPGAGIVQTIAPAGDIRSLNLLTLAGGTVLTMNMGVWASETTWPTGAGGIFTNVSIPTYQQNANPGNPAVSAISRNAPDVSAIAQNIYFITSDCNNSPSPAVVNTVLTPAQCVNHNCPPPPPPLIPVPNGNRVLQACPAAQITPGQAQVFNGTSAAAPIWAAFTALVNQQSNTGPIGFMNPTLYQIGKTPARYANSFHDIQDMSNNNNSCGFGYNAVAGYDLATGWGTPQCQLVAQINAPRPRITLGVSSTPQQGPVICINGQGFTKGGTVNIQYAGVPEQPVIAGTSTPQPLTVTSNQAVDTNGNFGFSDVNQIEFVANSVAAGVAACTPQEIANGTVSVNVTDNTLGTSATATMPASLWCKTNDGVTVGAGCQPAPVVTITLSNIAFSTTGSNLFNCNSPANMNMQAIKGETNGQIIITCTPQFANGMVSTTQQPFSQEVSCGDGHGALFTGSCQGTGSAGNAVNGSLTFTIEDKCASGLVDSNNATTFTFTNLVPGAPQSSPGIGPDRSVTNALSSCDSFSNACSVGNKCLFNDFKASVTVKSL